jgi:thiol-disulfide isomerase/thioredoxin
MGLEPSIAPLGAYALFSQTAWILPSGAPKCGFQPAECDPGNAWDQINDSGRNLASRTFLKKRKHNTRPMKFPMRAISVALLTASALAATPSNPLDAEGPWFADYDEAVKVARAEGKDLFVDFTGSDWCGWCIKLDTEVFEHDEWLETAQKEYVLVKLDFPRKQEIKDLVPNPERNEELKNQFGVAGFPTILLVTADGDSFGQTGYQKGGPAPYLLHMATLRKEGKAKLKPVLDLLATYRQARGKAIAPAWNAIADHLATAGRTSPGASGCLEVVKSVIANKSEGTAGLIPRAIEVLISVKEVDLELAQAVAEMDPKNEAGTLEDAIFALVNSAVTKEQLGAATALAKTYMDLGKIDDPEHGFYIMLLGAHWSARFLDDADGAKVFAKNALALDAGRDDMRTFLEELMTAEPEEPAEGDGSGK